MAIDALTTPSPITSHPVSNGSATPVTQLKPLAGSTRRALLTGAATVAACASLQVTAIAGEHPDAELISACTAFDDLERAYLAARPISIANEQLLWEAQRTLAVRMVELRAGTLAGHVARAQSLALWEGDMPSGDINSEYINERLLGAVLRDLLAGSAVG